MKRQPRPPRGGGRGALAGAVLLALGIALLAWSCAPLVAGDAPSSLEMRGVARSLVAGLALSAYAVILLLEARRGRASEDSAPPARPSGSSAPVPPIAPSVPTGRAAGDVPSGKAAGSPSPHAPTSLEGLLARTDDVLVTLCDLVEHGQGQEGYGALPALLEGAGIRAWERPPRAHARRLTRSGRWWLSFDSDNVPAGDLDCALAVEAALNLADDLAAQPSAEGADLSSRVLSVLARTADLDVAIRDGDAALAAAGPGQGDGEWACRARFSCFCENAPTPFRTSCSFQVNLDAGELVADAEVPPPERMLVSLAGPGLPSRVAARAYALRLALLLGRGALESSTSVGRATVNCHAGDEGVTLLSVTLTRDSLPRLLRVARSSDDPVTALAGDPSLRATPTADGWLGPVTPLARRDDPGVCPDSRLAPVDLDERPVPQAVTLTCGARRACDLGIMESAGRVEAWRELEGCLGGSTRDAVARLVELRDATGDLTVAEACDRVAKELVDGSVDASDADTLRLLFVHGGALAAAARRLRAALGRESSAEELEEALAQADEVLSPISQTGAYLDDGSTVFRYFNSVPERVLYNLTSDDGGRRVRLVPDEYYVALSCAAQILLLLGRVEEARARAAELVRVAPCTPDAAFLEARCLEEGSRVFEAANLLADAIGRSSTARDLSICFYRLAFMEWRLGHGQLAAACYQWSASFRTDVSAQASSELADLLASDDSLSPLDDKEAARCIEGAGLPTGPLDERRSMLRDAAAACTDAGILSVARPLTAALLEYDRDDAIAGVYRSLSR